MYAAAGGASLASRQKRKNQAAQNVKNKALLQQGLKDKLAASRASSLAPPTKAQSRQFHNLPSSYLRTPQAQVRKSSAGYTTQSRLLLPINEGNSQILDGQHHPHPHLHHPQQFHGHHSQLSSAPPHHHGHHHDRAHSPRPSQHQLHSYVPHQKHLIKSATASLPLVSQLDATPPDSPILFTASQHHPKEDDDQVIFGKLPQSPTHIAIPFQQDDIIITPATPLPSPGPPTADQLERRCSFYRGKKLLAYEESLKKTTESPTINKNDDLHYGDECQTPYLPNGVDKWVDSDYCESEHRHMGVCTCDHIECAQGRAAWLERGRRCSVQENAASYHRRWVKRNRIHDSSLGGSSDDDDFLGVLRGPSSFANAFLYVGLGSIAIGLVIAFVGTGEKGFKTVELRLIGPSLIVIGLVCCILRIFFCICPSNCISSSRRKLKIKNAKVDADHTTSLLRGDGKCVSISRQAQSRYQQSGQRGKNQPNSKMNEGMEALRHLATTSLFLRNEQHTTENIRIVPTITEPDNSGEEPLEMKKIYDMSLEVCSISDDEDELALNEPIQIGLGPDLQSAIASGYSASLDTISDILEPLPPIPSSSKQEPSQQISQTQRPNKLIRSRAPVNQSRPNKDIDLMLMETSLMALNSASKSASSSRPANKPSTSSKPSSTLTMANQSKSQEKKLNYGISLQPLSSSSASYQTSSKKPAGIKETPITATAIASTSKQHKSAIQDGSTKITIVQPTDKPNTSQIESELVLSPAKLGQ